MDRCLGRRARYDVLDRPNRRGLRRNVACENCDSRVRGDQRPHGTCNDDFDPCTRLREARAHADAVPDQLHLPCVANELCSLPKDLLDECGSLLFYTMLQKSWTVEQTMDHFVALHDDAVEEVDRLEAQLSAEGLLDANHVEFLTRIREHVVGFNGFYTKAKRYTMWNAVNHKDQTCFKVVLQSVDDSRGEAKAGLTGGFTGVVAGVVVPAASAVLEDNAATP